MDILLGKQMDTPKFTDEELEYLWFAIQNYQPFDFDNKEECELYHKVYKKIDTYFLRKIDD